MSWILRIWHRREPPGHCRDCGTELQLCPAPHAGPGGSTCQSCFRDLICPIHRRWWTTP